jgi:hypothetical protein
MIELSDFREVEKYLGLREVVVKRLQWYDLEKLSSSVFVLVTVCALPFSLPFPKIPVSRLPSYFLFD